MSRQRGGASDWMHSFHAASSTDGACVQKTLLNGIGNSPMFNPLNSNAVIPGNSTGIVPSGTYLLQTGGAGYSTDYLRTLCNKLGMSCRGPKGGFLGRKTLLKKIAGAQKKQRGGFDGHSDDISNIPKWNINR